MIPEASFEVHNKANLSTIVSHCWQIGGSLVGIVFSCMVKLVCCVGTCPYFLFSGKGDCAHSFLHEPVPWNSNSLNWFQSWCGVILEKASHWPLLWSVVLLVVNPSMWITWEHFDIVRVGNSILMLCIWRTVGIFGPPSQLSILLSIWHFQAWVTDFSGFWKKIKIECIFMCNKWLKHKKVILILRYTLPFIEQSLFTLPFAPLLVSPQGMKNRWIQWGHHHHELYHSVL